MITLTLSFYKLRVSKEYLTKNMFDECFCLPLQLHHRTYTSNHDDDDDVTVNGFYTRVA